MPKRTGMDQVVVRDERMEEEEENHPACCLIIDTRTGEAIRLFRLKLMTELSAD
jgi:hypothetical protein